MGLGVMTWGEARGLGRLHPSQSAYGGTETRAAEQEAFEQAMQAGVNFFDSAAMYGGGASERRLGELSAGRKVIIASKFPSNFFFKAEQFPQELEGSLQRLGRDHIDLYQHHFPNRRVSIPLLMDEMARAVEAGKILAVGVSNYSAAQIRQAHAALARHGIPLASVQNEYSLLNRTPEKDGVLEACRELGITLIAYQPLASGRLTGKYRAGGPRPRGLRRWMPMFSSTSLHKVEGLVQTLEAIGHGYGKIPCQVALRWLMEQPNVVPIPGAKTARQAEENCGALTFRLTPEEVSALDEAARGKDQPAMRSTTQ
jgi:aryl-alcohol dehydrogenase-like predicted oxidoreductase